MITSPENPHRVAVGYIRVSTVRQADEGVSLDHQRQRIRAMCDLDGLTLAGIHADEGISGRSTRKRPELEAAMQAACDAGGVLVVYSLSRFARSTRDCLALAQRLKDHGAALVSITEKIDTDSPHGKFFFVLLAAIAQLESDQTSQRVRDIVARKRANHQAYGSQEPWGWDFVGGLMVPNQAEQLVVDRVIAQRAKCRSFQRIAEDLNAQGVPTKKGRTWSTWNLWRCMLRAAGERGVDIRMTPAERHAQRSGALRRANRAKERKRSARRKAAPPPKPRRMSFGRTAEQIRRGTQTQTRRRGFQHLRPGQTILAVDRMVPATDAPSTSLGRFRVESVRRQRLADIDQAGVTAEGFPSLSPPEFVSLWLTWHGGSADQEVTVVTFAPEGCTPNLPVIWRGDAES